VARDADAPARAAAEPPGKPAPARIGRPPLTERRKAATRLEIAHEAVRLFTANGVPATSTEEIAAAAGISVRTLWRYFPNKESCVLPLLTGGMELITRYLRARPSGRGAEDVLDSLLTEGIGFAVDMPTLLNLVRLTATEPGLRAVWLQAHHEAEPVFAGLLAERAGLPGPDLATTVQAAMLNSALRAAVEHYALHTDPAASDEAGFLQALRTALRVATHGLLR